MNDAMRFKPDRISVKRGETIRFIVRNTGNLRHEMVLGTIDEMKEHAEMMRKKPEMEHTDPNQVSVEPGKTGELIWRFTRDGTFDFACLEPGHLEAGMAGKILVGRGGFPSNGTGETGGAGHVLRRLVCIRELERGDFPRGARSGFRPTVAVIYTHSVC